MAPIDEGQEIYKLVEKLFPICRSLTGEGTRETLKIIKEIIPIEIKEVPTGTKVFDWSVPKEWNIKDGYVLDPEGNKIIDFKKNNLHVVGYSIPVNKEIDLIELQDHLHSLEYQLDAIPYVTSYYKERWGFCLSQNQRNKLVDGKYKVVIDSSLKEGSLTYAELIIKGESSKEIFLSSYVCHPSMANNELSGPCILTYLAKWLMSAPRYYTYRIVLAPETIGALTYISKNLEALKNVKAAFNFTCMGDERTFSFMPSRKGDTYADKVALNVLKFKNIKFDHYSFLDRQSDERQYCSPGVDLPMVSIMRSKYASYPEYHTSLDNLDLVTPRGLGDSFAVMKACLEVLEANKVYVATNVGEPQLGKRGLYPTLSKKGSTQHVKTLKNFLMYADGNNDLIDISNKINSAVWDILPIAERLIEEGLVK